MKTNILISIVFISFLSYGFAVFRLGKINSTKKNGNGCVCHSFTSSEDVIVWVEGPDSVVVGSNQLYKMFMTGGPAVAGGYNIATFFGQLNILDTNSILIENEITQNYPLLFQTDTIYWTFSYTAPLAPNSFDTLYSTGLSVNFDGIPDEQDMWAYGDNFVIKIIDSNSASNIKNIETNPTEFLLSQNFPNPFNPITNISFNLPYRTSIQLKLFTTSGELIRILADSEYAQGNHIIKFEGTELATGVYIYQLTANSVDGLEKQVFSESKKLIIIK